MKTARKARVTWTIFNGIASKLVCKRCGGEWSVTMPITVDAFVALGRAFDIEHGDCVEPKGGAQ